MGDVPVGGSCDPRFERVREVFTANFTERGDIGASVAVTLDGVPVVDLWGGWADEACTRPWQRDTIAAVWSVGKAVTSVCALRLVERGLIELEAPVARYWPEFAQAGKERIPVQMLFNHQAGLPAIRRPLPPGANILDWDLTVAALAGQEPWWEPGTRFGYHVNTIGFLLGELVRRVDGRTIGTYLREELAQGMGIDFLIGVPEAEDSRVAQWLPYRAAPGEEAQRPWLERDPAELEGVDLARVLAYRNPPAMGGGGPNSRVWRAAEFPSTNPHSNARAIARLFGGLACGGIIDGRQLLTPETIARATVIESDGEDAILGRPNRFGLGFQLTIPGVRPLGPSPRAFGHYGNGAVLGMADPDARLGFGYVCNRAGKSWRDPRNIALMDAVYAAAMA